MTPLLSICIPTYNRAPYLKESLARLVEELLATGGDVEVVISDNCSTDETESVCRAFVAQVPDKIVYVRQQTNIGPSDNFTYLLSHARGKFIKFQNDNLIIVPGLLARICDFIRTHESEHPVVFFGSECVIQRPLGEYVCRTHDEFLETVSYWTTWIGGYGLWRDEVDFVLPIQDKYAASFLQQVAVLWSLFEKNKIAYFCNWKQYEDRNAIPGKKGGYNVAEVFSQNYLRILKEFKGPNRISESAYEVEKKRLYKWHIFNMYFDFNHHRAFDRGRFFYYTRDYHLNAYYWFSFALWPVYKILGMLPSNILDPLVAIYRKVRRCVSER